MKPDFISAEEKTSTGLPTHQSFTPPVDQPIHYKDNSTYYIKNHFVDLFPEEELSKRPFSTTINVTPEKVYATINDLQNFPIFFEQIQKIESISKNQARWFLKDDEEFMIPMKLANFSNTFLIVWQTEDAAGFDMTLAMSLEKAQADRGTVVRIMNVYENAAADTLSKLEKLFGKNPATSLKKALQNLKTFCETGHIPTIEGQPSGRDKDSILLSPKPQKQTLKH